MKSLPIARDTPVLKKTDSSLPNRAIFIIHQWLSFDDLSYNMMSTYPISHRVYFIVFTLFLIACFKFIISTKIKYTEIYCFIRHNLEN